VEGRARATPDSVQGKARSDPASNSQNNFFISKRAKPLNHRIHISGNHVTGDVVLTSPTPIIAAAHAILARPGSSPSDTLSVACPDVTVIPQTLGAVVAERPTSHRNNLMREMMGFDRR
jgi:hypothetical protein